MSRDAITTSGGTTQYLSSYNAGSSVDLSPNMSGSNETKSVWTYDFQRTSYPLVFLAPPSGEMDGETLPSNHPIWDEVEAVLTKIWAEAEYVAPEIDDQWLNETRSSWNDRLEDLYDEFDTGE